MFRAYLYNSPWGLVKWSSGDRDGTCKAVEGFRSWAALEETP